MSSPKRLPIAPDERPRVRGDCVGGPRPCPWVSCRYHLYLDVLEGRRGIIKLNWKHIPPEELERMPASCALDVADAGEHSQAHTASLIGLGSEQAYQGIQGRAFEKLQGAMNGHGLDLLRDLAASADASEPVNVFELADDTTVVFTLDESIKLSSITRRLKKRKRKKS